MRLRLLQNFQLSNRASIVEIAVVIAMTVPIMAMILRPLLLELELPCDIESPLSKAFVLEL